MQSRLKQHTASTTLLLAVIGASQVALSEPVIDDYSISLDRKSASNQSLLVTIRGQGFGEKSQPEPVLWVFGNDVRQNGESVDNPTYQLGENVGDTGPSIWSSVDSNVVFDSLTRYDELEHSYFTGQDGTVRNPLAFGGEDPPYTDKTYFSARIKPSGPIHNYRGIAFSDLKGNFEFGDSNFDEGERVTIDGPEEKIEGTIIGIDPDAGIVTIMADISSANSDGALVTGTASGASLKLNSEVEYQSPSASKYYRMWSGGRPGMYSTLSTNRLISGYRSEDGNHHRRSYHDDGSRDRGYDIPNMTSTMDWRLLEMGIDQSGHTASAYIDIDNSGRRHTGNIDLTDIKLYDRSPTISQLGWDAAGGRKKVHVGLHFGEIYFDTTPQRVMISSERTYTDSGNELELQYPKIWSDEKIVFELRTGALDTTQELFVYIFDEDNTTNQEGLEICVSCALGAPGPTTLDVE